MRSTTAKSGALTTATRCFATLPYRIRAPLARLQARKAVPVEAFRAPSLGDGEQLESAATHPDYLAFALRSKVYDFLSDTPLQHAPALSDHLGATVHIKREDLNPTFTFYARCAINELALVKASGSQNVVTASIGSRGHALAWAAGKLGMRLTVVMPSPTPMSRRDAVSRLGATVLIHGDTIFDSKEEAARLVTVEGRVPVGSHDATPVLAAAGTVGLELLRQHGLASVGAAVADTASATDIGMVRRRSAATPLDAIFVGVGGGSLLSGIASVIKSTSPQTKVGDE